MKKIKVNTVQGIGDLLWVYRKLAPLCDKIDFNILLISDNPIEKRSDAFLKTLEKCNDVTFTLDNGQYRNLVAFKPKLRSLNDGDVINYAVNGWLESGVHIDDIDEFPVLWDLNLKSEDVIGLPEKYLLVYASGSSRHEQVSQLTTSAWAELILETAGLKGLTDVVFIGAAYDAWKFADIKKEISEKINCIDCFMDIRKTMYVIQNAEFFIAYQSGLCMLAEEFGIPTLMIWFPHLQIMQNTWIRSKNIEDKLFIHCLFNEPIKTMLDRIKE